MGAFFMSPPRFANGPVREVFSKKGFGPPVELKTGSGTVLLYRKQLVDEANYRFIGKSLIFSVGTLFYKNQRFAESLAAIFDDFIAGTLDTNAMIGSYFVFIEHEGRVCFFTDRAGVQNVFFSRESRVISSSFLAVLTALGEVSGKQAINRQSLCEVLSTGNLIGPDTLIAGIERFEPAIHPDLPGIKKTGRQHDKKKDPTPAIRRSTAAAKQLYVLCEYFSACAEPLQHYGVSSGLTGGFDSRLLYLVFRKFIRHYQLYSTPRENPGPEFHCAAELARKAKEPLVSLAHTPPEKMGPAELADMLANNFYFNDGQIRTHQLWLEEIKGRGYLKKLYGGFAIGFSGVGGEQYRNGQYLTRKRYPFRSWVRSELLGGVSGFPFTDAAAGTAFLQQLQDKVARLLGMPAQAKFISKKEIKRYYNEIWNPANRTVRNNVENQLVFFLSPFSDYTVSRAAYDAVPFLGNGPGFEMEMIRQAAPELAACRTDYGFPIAGKASFRLRSIPLIKSLLGLKLYNQLFFLKKNRKAAYYQSLLRVHPGLNDFTANVASLNLPLDLDKLKRNDFLAPLLIEAGFFLSVMKKYIEP